MRKIQLKALEILVQADTPQEFANRVRDMVIFVEHAKRERRGGRIPLDELIVRQKLSRTLDGYKPQSPAARATLQL